MTLGHGAEWQSENHCVLVPSLGSQFIGLLAICFVYDPRPLSVNAELLAHSLAVSRKAFSR